jgi:hemoglobin/transferrin/lactoferrin receptor protein
MGSLRNKCHLSLSLCLIAARVHAAEPAEKAIEEKAIEEKHIEEKHIEEKHIEEKHIEETVVWGTQVYTSSMGLDAEAMDIKQADHISDLLRPIPGVDVGGAHSLNQRITIRSMDDKDLRISIDGANQNTYMYHHMGNLQIHADILQAVEVEVGNNSVVNGGLGGAVRFQTKEAGDLLRAGERFGAIGKLTVSDNASNNYAVSAYAQLSDTVDILGYYNLVDRQNYAVGGGNILNAEGNVIEGTDGKVRGLEGELTDALVKLGWNVTANQRLKIGYETYADEGDYSYRPDMGLATDMAIANSLNVPLVFPTKFTRGTLTLNYGIAVGGHTNIRTAIFRNESTLRRDEKGLAPWDPSQATINEGEAENTGLNILADSTFHLGIPHTLTYGVDHVEYKTGYRVDNQFINGEQSTQAAVFIEDRIELTDSLWLTPGLRYDTANVATRVVDDNFTEALWALAGEYQIIDNLLVRLSTTQLFRAPEIGEVFTGAGSGDTPNPALKAETGSNSELAVAYEIWSFSAGATLFRTQIHDYIYDYAETAPRTYWKDNVGDLSIEGHEVYVEWEQDDWRMLATYTSAESELDAFENYAALDGARIDREQGDSIGLNLRYTIAPVNITLQWEALHVRDLGSGIDLDSTSDDSDNAKDSYTVHNISGRWTPGSGLQGLAITLGVDNLFDEFYASQSSRTGTSFHPRFGQLYLLDYEPGRNLKAAIAYQF